MHSHVVHVHPREYAVVRAGELLALLQAVRAKEATHSNVEQQVELLVEGPHAPRVRAVLPAKGEEGLVIDQEA